MEGTSCSIFWLISRHFDQKGMKPRFVAFFKNWVQKGVNFFLDFGYFNGFETTKELTYSSILGYFYEFESRRELTY